MANDSKKRMYGDPPLTKKQLEQLYQEKRYGITVTLKYGQQAKEQYKEYKKQRDSGKTIDQAYKMSSEQKETDRRNKIESNVSNYKRMWSGASTSRRKKFRDDTIKSIRLVDGDQAAEKLKKEYDKIDSESQKNIEERKAKALQEKKQSKTTNNKPVEKTQPKTTNNKPVEKTQPKTTNNKPAEKTQPKTTNNKPAEKTQPKTTSNKPAEKKQSSSVKPKQKSQSSVVPKADLNNNTMLTSIDQINKDTPLKEIRPLIYNYFLKNGSDKNKNAELLSINQKIFDTYGEYAFNNEWTNYIKERNEKTYNDNLERLHFLKNFYNKHIQKFGAEPGKSTSADFDKDYTFNLSQNELEYYSKNGKLKDENLQRAIDEGIIKFNYNSGSLVMRPSSFLKEYETAYNKLSPEKKIELIHDDGTGVLRPGKNLLYNRKLEQEYYDNITKDYGIENSYLSIEFDKEFEHKDGYRPDEKVKERVMNNLNEYVIVPKSESFRPPPTEEDAGEPDSGSTGREETFTPNNSEEVEYDTTFIDSLIANHKPYEENPFIEREYKSAPVPWADIAQSLFGIAVGQSMADQELPDRDERVDEEIIRMANEYKKISKLGLDPVEEAKIKDMLSEIYNTGLNNIVNNSAGNRNLILGNLGRLDSQNQAGLMQMAELDLRKKSEAMDKYGQILSMISQVNLGRDIANNEREYENQVRNAQAGGALAAAGWKSLIDNIQNHKDMSPGGAMFEYLNYMYSKGGGINPFAKPGTYGSEEWYKAEHEKIKSENLKYDSYIERLKDLTPKQRIEVQKIFDQTGNLGEAAKTYFDGPGSENRNANEGLNENDFFDQNGIITLTDQQLNADDPSSQSSQYDNPEYSWFPDNIKPFTSLTLNGIDQRPKTSWLNASENLKEQMGDQDPDVFFDEFYRNYQDQKDTGISNKADYFMDLFGKQ